MKDATCLIALADQIAGEVPLRDRLRWVFAHPDDGVGYVIVPASLPPFLYRGQTARHRPCLPSICRQFDPLGPAVSDLCRRDQLLLIKHLAQGLWFETILDSHPAARWAAGQKLRLNRVALAQHYGIPTGYVDLTESFDVAAFFATCYLDKTSKQWRACDDGEGVLYRLHWKLIPPKPKRVRWIGLQPFPRPAEQWAWVCELFLGEDLEGTPFLQILPFKHSREAGEHFLNKFSGGEALFPSDPMARVAERLAQADTLPVGALTETIADLFADPKGLSETTEDALLKEIESELGITISTDCPSPLDEVDIQELESIWEERKESFFHGVGVQLVRTRKDN